MATYEQTTEVRTEPVSPVAIGPRPEYLRSTNGILKIAEIVLSMIVIICASYRSWAGSGFVEFVGIWAMVTTIVWLVFHFINLVPRLPGNWVLFEWISYLIYCLLYTIATIVAIVKVTWHSSIAATTVFCILALITYAVDTWMSYRVWTVTRIPAQSASGPSTVTTNTTTTYETRTQY